MTTQEIIDSYIQYLRKNNGTTLSNYLNSLQIASTYELHQDVYNEVYSADYYYLLNDRSFTTAGGKNVWYELTPQATNALKKFDNLQTYVDHLDKEARDNRRLFGDNNIIGATITGANINQGSDLRDSNLSINPKINTPTETPQKKSSQDVWEKAKIIATILAFLTAVLGIITKAMDLW